MVDEELEDAWRVSTLAAEVAVSAKTKSGEKSDDEKFSLFSGDFSAGADRFREGILAFYNN